MKKSQTKSTRIFELNKNKNTNINICEMQSNYYLEGNFIALNIYIRRQ